MDKLSDIKNRLNMAKGSWRHIEKSSGVPYSTITKIAQGITDNPRWKTMDRLERYFDENKPTQP